MHRNKNIVQYFPQQTSFRPQASKNQKWQFKHQNPHKINFAHSPSTAHSYQPHLNFDWGCLDFLCCLHFEVTSLFEIVFILGQSLFWHERASFQRSAFGRSTAGNDVAATIFIRLFSFFPLFFSPFFSRFSSVATFSHRRSARIWKPILRKLFEAPNNLWLNPSPVPVGHVGRCGVAGGERVPLLLLGLYF